MVITRLFGWGEGGGLCSFGEGKDVMIGARPAPDAIVEELRGCEDDFVGVLSYLCALRKGL